MPDIDSLKEKKEALFGHKRGILDQRQEAVVKLRALREEISDVKNQRNQFNQLVQENKKKRSDADARIKQLSKELQVLRSSQQIAPLPGKMADVEKRLNGLEWDYQTQSLSPVDDKKMSRKIQELTLHLQDLKEGERIKKDIGQKQQEIGDLQKEQKIYHLNVLTNAERSEAKHQELLGIYKRADELKTEKEKFDEQLGPISQQISDIRDELNTEFDKVKAGKEKAVTKVQAKQGRLLEEKVKLVQQKIKNGEKLTTKDILIIQQADLEI